MMIAKDSFTIKRFLEDPKFRQFQSSHFDGQSYIKNVIKDGSSEINFNEMVASIGEVNDEIKRYISQHRESLMSGMQDVAVLAGKYQSLLILTSKLRNAVEKLKKDALDSYDLVYSRTMELERIHRTSITLRLIRQFAHLKSQLDHHMNNSNSSKESDPRHLAVIAKTTSELEQLLTNPSLHEIQFVMDQSAAIRSFGQNLRQLAQEMILSSLKDRNQATVASCLQIFFNLQSLPEILLLAIDSTIRNAIDTSKDTLDFDHLITLHPELAGSTGNISSTVTGSVTSATQRNIPAPTPKKESTSATGLTPSQLRGILRETSQLWATQIYDHAMQILVLERVMAKKEDPTTHKKFQDTLRQMTGGNALLAHCQLLELFWERLSVTLQDYVTEKVKKYSTCATRVYPSLRRAAMEVLQSIQVMSSASTSNNTSNNTTTSSNNYSRIDDGGISSTTNTMTPSSSFDLTSFGCSLWPQDDVLCSLGLGNRRYNKLLTSSSTLLDSTHSLTRDSLANKSSDSTRNKMSGSSNESGGGGGGEYTESGLLLGLKPISDRYLSQVLTRLTAPVHQMFPEVEGFQAAVPSKRDLLTYLTAIQNELLMVVIESDKSLLQPVCKEILKSIKLITSKVEGMMMTGPEAKKVTATHHFARTPQQEHNGQLVSLLSQLLDSLHNLPSQVLKLAQDSLLLLLPNIGMVGQGQGQGNNNSGNNSGSSVPGGIGSNQQSQTILAEIHSELTTRLSSCIAFVEDIMIKQFISPLVDYLSVYFRGILIGLLKEGRSSTEEVECSRVVQLLLKQIPEIITSHISTLPKGKTITLGKEELLLRLLASYVSTAALVKPLTEAIRLRTAKDMTALEGLVQSLLGDVTGSTGGAPGGGDWQMSTVMQEFKAFRRLLFSAEGPTPTPTPTPAVSPNTAATTTATTTVPLPIVIAHPPSKEALIGLSYLPALRPSTLLAYLCASAPSQLPTIYEGMKVTVEDYLEFIITPPSNLMDISSYPPLVTGNKSEMNSQLKYRLNCSVRFLYMSDWSQSPCEVRMWHGLKESIDILLQRASVVTEADTQKLLRGWGLALRDVGDLVFSTSLTITSH